MEGTAKREEHSEEKEEEEQQSEMDSGGIRKSERKAEGMQYRMNGKERKHREENKKKQIQARNE